MEQFFLVRCACNACGTHLACMMGKEGPEGRCPGCRCAFLTPVRTQAGGLEAVAEDDLGRSLRY